MKCRDKWSKILMLNPEVVVESSKLTKSKHSSKFNGSRALVSADLKETYVEYLEVHVEIRF